jgi:hypothetical protein
MGALELLFKVLQLDPNTAEIDVLVRIIEHIGEALTITNYQIGDATYTIGQVKDNPAHVTLTNLLTPYLNAHGNVVDPTASPPKTYGLESKRYLVGSGNTASVNNMEIPEGLVLHLVGVDPQITDEAGALVTLGYIFPATANTPAITLLAKVTIGILQAGTKVIKQGQ